MDPPAKNIPTSWFVNVCSHVPTLKISTSSTLTTKKILFMPSFSLPPINDNPDGGWGPSSSNLPDQFKFKDIPYAPYSKSDKLGRFADWNDLSTDNRQTTVGLPVTQNVRGGAGGRRGRDGNATFGSGTASAFAYFHVEDESSFSLVDNKTAPPRRGNAFVRGNRGTNRGGTYPRGNQRGGRGMFNSGRLNNNQRGGRRGWRDWEKVCLISNFIFRVLLTNVLLRIIVRGSLL